MNALTYVPLWTRFDVTTTEQQVTDKSFHKGGFVLRRAVEHTHQAVAGVNAGKGDAFAFPEEQAESC